MIQPKRTICVLFCFIFLYTCGQKIFAQEGSTTYTTPSTINLPKDSIPDMEIITSSALNLPLELMPPNEAYTSPILLNKNFKSIYPGLIVPSVFITYGIIARNNDLVREIDLSTNNEVKEHYTQQIPYDNYTQFIPAASVYGLNFLGIKGKHNLKDVTIIMATSHLLMTATVQTLKNTTKIRRPDGSTNNSFPSGHTATAFVGAHILFREYYKTSLWLASSGYVMSTATGVLRILNERHWVSDVVIGAGVGILSVEISYLLLPVINNILYPNKKNNNLSFVPNVSKRNFGLDMVYAF